MSPFRHAARWAGAAVVGTLLAAVPGLSASATTPSPVELASSSPASDQTLDDHPSLVRLVFSQDLGGNAVDIVVVCNGTPAEVGDVAPDPDGRSVDAPLAGTQVGACSVTWSVPSATGQPITGNYSFTIDAAADEAETDTTEPASTDTTTTVAEAGDDGGDDASTPAGSSASEEGASNVGGPLGLARFFSFVGVLALFGALVLIALHWHEGVEYLVTLRYLRVIWIIGAVATVFVVIFSTARLPGNSLGGAVSPAAWGDLFDTTTGKALLARLLLVLASGWVAWQPDRVTDPATQLVAIGVPGLAVATLGIARTGGSAEVIGFLGGIMQALGASVWFGGLLLLTRAVLVGPGEEDLVHAVRGFGRLAPPAIAATVAGGLIQVYRLDGFALLTTGHGRLAILSAIAIGLAIYLGTATRQFAAQRLGQADHLDGRLAHRLRRAFSIEVAVGVVALLLTAWMLTLSPPKVKAEPPRDTTEYAFVSPRLPSGSAFDVRLSVTSTVIGPIGVRLEVFEPKDGLSGLQIRFVPPPDAAATTNEIAIVVPLDGEGAAVLPESAGVGLEVAGNWSVDISATLPDGTQQVARVSNLIITAEADPAAGATTTTVAADPNATTVAATAAATTPSSTP
jgi:putative copper export protein/methionine-rich copper-binding protein CopC